MFEFLTPLAINQCKAGDELLFSAEEETGYDLVLTVYDIDDNITYGPVYCDTTRSGYEYWTLNANSTYGMASVQTYYTIEIDDIDTSDYIPAYYTVYVNNDYAAEQYIVRSLGLAGHNIRMFSHTWTNGLLTQFDIKFYSTAADVTAADAGTADDYLAHYRVTILYDNSYNPYSITSIRVA